MITDTIAAIATPPGAGGIGIIRISGSRSIEVLSQIFKKSCRTVGRSLSCSTELPSSSKKNISTSALFESHKITHGYIIDTSVGASLDSSTQAAVIDEVLVIPMLAPRSYTAEDVVEIQAHSGPLVMQTILEIILSKDVRLAEPGEFTKRAFLNGRIDLTQAEAVADIINARSSASLKIAVSQGLGNLKNTIINAREELVSLLAQIEVAIDFPEESGDILSKDIAIQAIKTALDTFSHAIQRYEDAHFLKDGLRIAICGPPNVGKSSLMNRLLEKERSIVTAFPGTTRDLIEESLNINGVPFVISDTAGMHDTKDPVEKIGIEKAKENIIESDMVLLVEDASYISDNFSTEQNDFNIDENNINQNSLNILKKRMKAIIPEDKKVIVVLNKIDKLSKDSIVSLTSKSEMSAIPVIVISAKCNCGIDLLRKKITEVATANLTAKTWNLFTNKTMITDNNLNYLSSVVPNIRHKTALKKASERLNLALENLLDSLGDYKSNLDSLGEETLAIDIRNAIDFLGEITGDTAGVDILDNIFSKFCIGK